MAAKVKVDQIETVDGTGSITLNNDIAMASGKTLPAASVTGTHASFTSTGIDDNADALAITINSSEQVGIGTASPTGNSKVHIYNAASGQSTSSNNTELTIENSSNTGIQFLTPNTSLSGIWFGDPENKEIGRMYYTHSENSLKFFTDASERLRIDSDGIKFNADTAAANGLDDYEEGTWTPSFNFSSSSTTVTYGNINEGHYTKIGNVVYVTMMLHVSSYSGGSGDVKIGGLPFAAGPGYMQKMTSWTFRGDYINWESDWTQICMANHGNSNDWHIVAMRDNASNENVTNSQWRSANTYYNATGHYYTSS